MGMMTDECAACGHTKDEHSEFIDNQIATTSYVPERRQCLVDGCECHYFKMMGESLDFTISRDQLQFGTGESSESSDVVRAKIEDPYALSNQEIEKVMRKAEERWDFPPDLFDKVNELLRGTGYKVVQDKDW